jgi:anti-sigma regulatory factor (Ser/Thr protein kinase)
VTSADAGGADIHVPHDPAGAREARRALDAALENLVPPNLRADALLVAAELLGNAVRHAAPLPGGEITLGWRVQTDEVDTIIDLRVCDGGSTLVPRERIPEPDAVGGRGLAIVSALTRAWGVERYDASQCVWARLRGPLPGS